MKITFNTVYEKQRLKRLELLRKKAERDKVDKAIDEIIAEDVENPELALCLSLVYNPSYHKTKRR